MVRVGIIGLGVVGRRLFQQFSYHPQTEIVALCDVNNELLETSGQEVPQATKYTDYLALLDDESVELVYIAVPPALHYNIAIAAFAKGKHVLCEKPLANSTEEAEKMALAAEESGLIHAIHFPLVYSPSVALFREKVQAGYLGDLRRIDLKLHFDLWPRAWQQTPWIDGREQGGFIREITPHYIQLIHMLFGPIENVRSEVEFPADEARSEIGVLATMKLQSGTPVFVDGLANIAKKEHLAFTAYGTEGTISLENWSTLKVGAKSEPLTEVVHAAKPTDLITSIVRSIEQGKSENLITFKDGQYVQEILEQIRHPRA